MASVDPVVTTPDSDIEPWLPRFRQLSFFAKLLYMPDALSLAPQRRAQRVPKLFSRIRSNLRAEAPTRIEILLALLSSVLVIISFPDFNLWPLAWVGLVPLIVAVLGAPHLGTRAFLLGWLMGTVYFYGSCYWLTYAMVRYGHIPSIIAYLLLVPGAIIVGLFPGLFCLALARVVSRFGSAALFAAPFIWVALEWSRLGVTGQLWNAIGYSQAFVPGMIQAARWGGVYAVGFLIVAINATLTYLFLTRTKRSVGIAVGVFASVALIIAWQSRIPLEPQAHSEQPQTIIVAVQPNVPMEPTESLVESEALLARHVALSESALNAQANNPGSRVVIWPESPMTFMYARDSQFREWLTQFATKNRTSVIFNALEPAPANGTYNAAVLVNEQGRLVTQYDKIRLLPFGEYVPLPVWLPGASLAPVMVGDFTPGTKYPLMHLGEAKAGIFICFESAFPYIARRFTNDGADVLINISNDGYLGPTAVMKQHLANSVFRAVENNRPVLRVTNTGITAYITARGGVEDATNGYETAVRTWRVRNANHGKTFYTRHGDVFVGICAALSMLMLIGSSSRVRTLINFRPLIKE